MFQLAMTQVGRARNRPKTGSSLPLLPVGTFDWASLEAWRALSIISGYLGYVSWKLGLCLTTPEQILMTGRDLTSKW